MKLTNVNIYTYATQVGVFNNCDIKLPIRINFYLQKNIQMLQNAAEEIEQARMEIAQRFGTPSEDGSGYTISQEFMQAVNQELNDLFNLEQDIPIHIFKLSDFDGIELTYQQMSAIIFMVEED